MTIIMPMVTKVVNERAPQNRINLLADRAANTGRRECLLRGSALERFPVAGQF